MEDSGCLVDFGCCLISHPLYGHYSCQLKKAIEAFSSVFVFVRFEKDNVEFDTFQKFLSHIYGTLAQRREECNVFVIDPSVSLERVLTEQPWMDKISSVSESLSKMTELVKTVEIIKGISEEGDKVFHKLSAKVVPRFPHSVMGGTFDRLHNGHRILLGAALSVCSSSLTVGITSDMMIGSGKKVLKELVQPYSVRMEEVGRFLKMCNPDIERKLPPIDDPFGPSIVDPGLECIIVSEETMGGGKAVNQKREERTLSVLEILCVDCWDKTVSSDGKMENKISSTQKRQREMESKQKL